jgi:hypothetical protein
MELLIASGFVVFALFAVFGFINLMIQINKLPNEPVIKKRNPKQFDGVINEGPFVKTRKKIINEKD